MTEPVIPTVAPIPPGAAEPAVAPTARNQALDVLRAIAACMVLAGHAYLLSGSALDPRDRRLDKLIVFNFASGVWLFFALSGFLISLPYVRALITGAELPGSRSYAIRRVTRIMPAYLIALAVVVIWAPLDGKSVAAWQIPVHALLLHNLVPGEEQAVFFASWTLTLEVLFYLAVPAVAWLVRSRWPGPISVRAAQRAVLGLWAASIVWSIAAASTLSGHAKGQLWMRLLFPGMFSMFAPGVLTAVAIVAWRDLGQAPRWLTWVRGHVALTMIGALAFTVPAAIGATAVGHVLIYDLSRQGFAVAFGLLVLVAATGDRTRIPNGRFAVWLGSISYGIYLWQGVVMQILEKIGIAGHAPLVRRGIGPYLVHVGYLAAFAIPLAWLSWVLIERPAVRWGHDAARKVGGSSLFGRRLRSNHVSLEGEAEGGRPK